MKVGFYSPLPPARSGVADYAAALLSDLERRGTVEVNAKSCDVALYHLGNNALHAEIYRRALATPGVAVMHDAVLHHFLLGQLGEAAYLEEFVYNYGEWNRGLAVDLWRGRAGSGADERYFRYPMLKRVAERSQTIVVHNPAAARVVREHASQARIVEIPHLFRPPDLATDAEVLRYRASIGLDAGALVFGVFGYLRESKRLMAVLEAFAQVRRDFPRAVLLVAGDFVSSDLARAAEPLLTASGIVRLPYLEEHEFWLAAAATDICINLRYPSAGESSGISVRMMGLGKPVLVTQSEEYANVPEGSCVRIAPGAAERDSLIQHMTMLAGMGNVRVAIGSRAAALIASEYRLDVVGAQYWAALEQAARA